MLRYLLSGLMLPLVLTLGGCPADAPTDSTEPSDMTPQLDAPASTKAGEAVPMKARFADGAPTDGVTYEWFQVYGRSVEIVDPHSPEASFVAPSLPTDQTLLFRLDVIGPDGTIYSETVAVLVAADPEYALPGSEGAGATDNDPYPLVRLETSMGNIEIKLNRVKAPLTVNNFLRYVDDGFYENLLFHRVIADFVIQTGGFDLDLQEKETRDPIKNESDNGLKNDRGTIAMARRTPPDSATSQFYINVVDNDHLNSPDGANGYTVFGFVTSGMSIVDDISQVETETRSGMENVPVDDVILRRIVRVEQPGGSSGDGKGDGNEGGSLSGG